MNSTSKQLGMHNVPEPTTLALLTVGGIALLAQRRKIAWHRKPTL